MKLQIGIDGKNYEVDVEVLEEDSTFKPSAYVSPLGPVAVPSPATAIALKPSRGAPTHGDESSVCRSPVAGVILRVNVQAGQKLEANDLMMVLEAMKMETNVAAPAACTIKNVLIQPGDAVKVGQILVEFE